MRLTTRPDVFPSPLTVDQSVGYVNDWLDAATAVVVEPTVDHGRVLGELLRTVGTGGNLVNDAHLAALALEHRCSVVSYDNDFSRFERVRWERPGAKR